LTIWKPVAALSRSGRNECQLAVLIGGQVRYYAALCTAETARDQRGRRLGISRTPISALPRGTRPRSEPIFSVDGLAPLCSRKSWGDYQGIEKDEQHLFFDGRLSIILAQTHPRSMFQFRLVLLRSHSSLRANQSPSAGPAMRARGARAGEVVVISPAQELQPRSLGSSPRGLPRY